MDDLRNVFVGWVSNAIWALTLVLGTFFVVTYKRVIPTLGRKAPAPTLGQFYARTNLRFIRQLCGMLAVVLITYQVTFTFFLNTDVWRHVLGWLLELASLVFIILAFWADELTPHPKRNARQNRILGRIVNSIFPFWCILVVATIVYVEYFDPEMVANRRKISELEAVVKREEEQLKALEQGNTTPVSHGPSLHATTSPAAR